ncbi:MAG: hypothetical protein IJ740_06050 [Ruminococcus sp.]|nr:hypothetical protein [Ruminococcus sp.]
MTREDVLKIFPNATPEEITAILNAHHSSVPKPKIGDEELSALREKAQKFDEYEAEKLSNDEKLQKALEDAEKLKITNQKMLNRTKALSELVTGGFSADEAEKVVDSIVSEDEEKTVSAAKVFAELFKARSDAVMKKAKEDLMKDTGRPDEGSREDDDKETDKRTGAEKLAAEIVGASARSDKSGQSALDYYTKR